MSSAIFWGDQSLFVSNQRLDTLFAFALQVGDATAASEEEKWVAKFRESRVQDFNGSDYDLDERFPEIAEKKFWARVFGDVARRIFLRQLGNHEITFWQTSAIADSRLIARMLTRAVRASEPGWRCKDEDGREAEDFFCSEEISAE